MVSNSVHTELLKYIAAVEEQVPLGRFNMLGVGGVADYFTVAHDAIELVATVRTAIDLHLPYRVIGLGQGLLFSDGGFPGMIIQNKAASHVLAADHSQMIVDSGMQLQQFITNAASQGFGGLTNLYGVGGTIGAGIYSNVQAGGQSLLSSVRFVTLLLPPTKMKVETTVVRYKSEWLTKEGGELTRLQHLRQTKSFEEPSPVILNAHIQLTSVRSDEVIRRIQQQANIHKAMHPSGAVFGPIFVELPGSDINLLLSTAGVDRLRVDGLQVDRRNRNFLKKAKGRPSAAGVWALCEELREAVQKVHGVALTYCFERAGMW